MQDMVTVHTTKFRSKIVYPVDQRVKFIKSGKYEQDFKAGDLGVVQRVISPFPSATDTIYLIVHEKSGELMWATGEDVIPFQQLTLDEEFAATVKSVREDKEKSAKSKAHVLCEASYYDEMVPCIKPYKHTGYHEAEGGLTWLTPHPGFGPAVSTWNKNDDDPYRVMSLNGFEHPFRNRYY